MKASVSIRQFLSWVLDSRVEEKLNNTCFIKLRGMAEFKCNNRFEGAIMSHFDENEFKFTFGEKSLYLGLEDVFHITGLPVDGCPVVVKKIDDYEKFSTRLLGSDDPERTENSPLVTKKWLLDTFKKVLDDITSVDEKLKWYVRAYILFTIGTILLPSNQKGTVSMVYLHHLEDLSVDSLNKIAWGAAVLAKLQGSFKNGKCTSGATWILEMFILERIPSIRDAYLYRRPTSTDEHPSCLMWSKFMKDNSHTSHSKIDWETSLNAIGDKFEWKPYKRFHLKRQRIFYSHCVIFDRKCDQRSRVRVLGAASCQLNWQGKACPQYTLVVGPLPGPSLSGDA